MPGKVLIIDNVATNRIVLKVTLEAASYRVAQATDGAEGLAAARQLDPDLILCSSRLPDMAIESFARALREHPRTKATPLIVETLRHDAEHRLALLDAGADDVLIKPHDEHLLPARLRSLLRMRETDEELNLREGASHALGLSEHPEPFEVPGRIAIVAAQQADALKWQHRLQHRVGHKFTALPINDALRRMIENDAPDAVALLLSPEIDDAGLRLLADLRAKPETRDCAVVLLIEDRRAEKIAADALDRGAADVITGAFCAREVGLRLDRQITRKRTLERLRSDMRDGLRAALIDPLTGLFNRRYAMPRLAAMADSAARAGGDFAAMVIDVDHFKAINDRFGHSAGDAVLIRLAEVLRQAAGEQNLLARVGGEEFLVAIPDTGRHAAEMAAQRICRMVRNTAFYLPGRAQPLQVTVSIGVALGSDHDRREDGQGGAAAAPHETVLERADRALYGAKTHGRNQVTISAERSAA